jgi:hypothetical protein
MGVYTERGLEFRRSADGAGRPAYSEGGGCSRWETYQQYSEAFGFRPDLMGTYRIPPGKRVSLLPTNQCHPAPPSADTKGGRE